MWDNGDWDEEIQKELVGSIQEIVDKWDVKLVGKEGKEGYVDELPHASVAVPPLDRSRVRILGLENSVYAYASEMAEFENFILELQSAGDETKQLGYYDELEQLVAQVRPIDIRDECGIFSDDYFLFRMDVSTHFRSYAAVDVLLSEMKENGDTVALFVQGSGHHQQVDGYLDYLGISHVDVVLDRELYLESRKTRPLFGELGKMDFDTTQLEEYHNKLAEGAFDLQH